MAYHRPSTSWLVALCGIGLGLGVVVAEATAGFWTGFYEVDSLGRAVVGDVPMSVPLSAMWLLGWCWVGVVWMTRTHIVASERAFGALQVAASSGFVLAAVLFLVSLVGYFVRGQGGWVAWTGSGAIAGLLVGLSALVVEMRPLLGESPLRDSDSDVGPS